MTRPAGPPSRVAIALPADDDVKKAVGDAYDPAQTLSFMKMLAHTKYLFRPAVGLVKALFQTEGIDPKTRQMIVRLFSSPLWTRCLQVSRMALVVSVMLASFQLLAQAQGKEHPMKHPTFYRTIQIDGLSIFYREAGPKDAPTLLLLHGLPSSSRMFEPLFARLSDRYQLVAPDYPGFGHSD
jgi:hypothetical protein